ncbi:MAG: hypothetical protein VYE40_14005 [Myxococcota bacterium]|jgi:hypothetical protein|nr:hypothetical protein [Myxococcota bacterium]
MTKIAVLIDAADERAQNLWSWGMEAEQIALEQHDEASALAALERLLERECEVVIVQGGVPFLMWLVTLHQRFFSSHETSLGFFPFTPQPTRLDAALALDEKPKKRARRVLDAGRKGKLQEKHLQTLRVTSSLEPHANLALDFGLGAIFDLQEASLRGQIAGAVQLGQMAAKLADEVINSPAKDGAATSARILVDGKPLARPPAYLLASVLPTSLFGLSMSREGGARLLRGEDLTELARDLARARAPLSLLRGEAAGFDRVVVDFEQRYLLDGELKTPGAPFVLQVEAGPRIKLLC